MVRDFPLESIHRDAFKAAEAAHCAGEQGKYWEMHHRLFANQRALGAAQLPEHAKAVGLDGGKFKECLDSGKYGARIRKDLADGNRAGVRGTPTFFIGITDSKDPNTIKGLTMIRGAQGFSGFQATLDDLLSKN